ncbi:hypothetical protein ACOSQ2_000245 [Xanthoceras sorbifolium]
MAMQYIFRTVFFGEYKSCGPGANPATRAKFTKQLIEEQARPFMVLGYIQGSQWLLPSSSSTTLNFNGQDSYDDDLATVLLLRFLKVFYVPVLVLLSSNI